jgi:hypothetical protein
MDEQWVCELSLKTSGYLEKIGTRKLVTKGSGRWGSSDSAAE